MKLDISTNQEIKRLKTESQRWRDLYTQARGKLRKIEQEIQEALDSGEKVDIVDIVDILSDKKGKTP